MKRKLKDISAKDVKVPRVPYFSKIHKGMKNPTTRTQKDKSGPLTRHPIHPIAQNPKNLGLLLQTNTISSRWCKIHTLEAFSCVLGIIIDRTLTYNRKQWLGGRIGGSLGKITIGVILMLKEKLIWTKWAVYKSAIT